MFRRWAVVIAWLVWPLAASAADAVAPTVPGNLQASVAAEKLFVTLTWTASTDNAGVRGYRLDRSLDQSNWDTVAGDITGLEYQDAKVGSGLHYYYRIVAIDTSGNISGMATTDVRTTEPNNAPETGGAPGGIFTSNDKRVTVNLPDGAAETTLVCSVSQRSLSSGRPAAGANQKLVSGPYVLLCKTAGGAAVTTFKKPLTWSFNLEDKLDGLNAPAAYTYASSGGAGVRVPGAIFNNKTQTLQVVVASSDPVAVLGNLPQGISPNIFVILLVVLILAGGIIVLVLRRKKKVDYEGYLRSKYYDL